MEQVVTRALERLGEKIDIGDPAQILQFTDILSEKDLKTQIEKLLSFLIDNFMHKEDDTDRLIRVMEEKFNEVEKIIY